MKYVLWNLAVALGLCMPLPSSGAQKPAPSSSPLPVSTIYQGQDIKAFVEYFRPQVQALKHAFTIYNWGAHNPAPFWNQAKPNDPSLINMVRNETKSFWGWYGSGDSGGNMYGYGLYAAADPLETVFYSSRDPERWMMTEMIIPAGFRMVDLSVDSPQTVTNPAVIQNAAEIAMKFGCESVSGHPAQELSEYFSLGGAWIPKTCSALIKTIFKDILKIDGIAYFYGAAMYSACTRTDNVYTRRAFVLATSDWITSSNVKVYTSKTTAELEDRIRIQTLVLNGIINPWGLQLTSSADSISVITAADASNQRPQTLIWADLDNKPKTPDVGTWIKANIFGCIPDSPYTVAK